MLERDIDKLSRILQRFSCQPKPLDQPVRNHWHSAILKRGPTAQGIKPLGLSAGLIDLTLGIEVDTLLDTSGKMSTKYLSYAGLKAT